MAGENDDRPSPDTQAEQAATEGVDLSQPGRLADSPTQIPKAGWRQVLHRVIREAGRDNLNIVAAGVAFFAVLSVFPAVTAAISIYGLFGDPAAISSELDSVSRVLPDDVINLIHNQMARIAAGQDSTLALGALISTFLALWSSNNGIRTFAQALTIVHGETARRGFIAGTAVSLSLTLGTLVFFIAATSLLGVIPAMLTYAHLSDLTQGLISILRWSLLFAVVVGLAMAVYRWGPHRKSPLWRWVWPGALVASIAWVIVSMGMSALLRHFSVFNMTYGPLTAMIVMMFWFYLTAYIFLLGGELNAELERQTVRDSTVGGRQPLGERGAYPADTVADAPPDT